MKEKTDKELVDLYYEDNEPITRIGLARQVKDEDLRMRLLNEAQRQRFLDDEVW